MAPLVLLAASHVATPAAALGDASSDDTSAKVAPPTEKRKLTVLHSIYAEGLGPLGLYSLNYDLAIGDIAVRVGGSYLPAGTFGGTGSKFIAGTTISFIGVGSETERLELGLSFAFLPDFLESSDSPASTYTVYPDGGSRTTRDLFLVGPHVGYRSHPTDGGFFTHVGLTTFVGVPDAPPVIPWPYLGFGVSI